MRYWTVVLVLLAVVAAVLPLVGWARTIIGDAQIVFALGLVALLIRLVAQAVGAGSAR